MNRLLPLAGALLMLTACSQTVTESCQDDHIVLQFGGFTDEELDTVILRRYVAGSGFTQPASTATLTSLPPNTARGQDVIQLPYQSDWSLEPGADYEIEVLATGTRARVADIRQEGQVSETYQREWGSKVYYVPCVNAITGFTVDGKQISVTAPETQSAFALIKK